MSLEERVLEYLEKKNKMFSMVSNKWKYGRRGITVREAFEVLGTTELRRIISRLRERGYTVHCIWEDGFNKHGDEVRYKRYFVEQGKK